MGVLEDTNVPATQQFQILGKRNRVRHREASVMMSASFWAAQLLERRRSFQSWSHILLGRQLKTSLFCFRLQWNTMQEHVKIHKKIELPFCRVQLICCCNWKYFSEWWHNKWELKEHGCRFLLGPTALLSPNKFLSLYFKSYLPVPNFLFSQLITYLLSKYGYLEADLWNLWELTLYGYLKKIQIQ